MILNVYTTNNGGSKFKKQKLTEMKREVDVSTIIVYESNTTLLATDRNTTQKISKYKKIWTTCLNQQNLIDIQNTPPNNNNNNNKRIDSFSSAHGTFTKVDQFLSHETNLNKFKGIQIIHRVFSEHNVIKL